MRTVRFKSWDIPFLIESSAVPGRTTNQGPPTLINAIQKSGGITLANLNEIQITRRLQDSQKNIKSQINLLYVPLEGNHEYNNFYWSR